MVSSSTSGDSSTVLYVGAHVSGELAQREVDRLRGPEVLLAVRVVGHPAREERGQVNALPAVTSAGRDELELLDPPTETAFLGRRIDHHPHLLRPGEPRLPGQRNGPLVLPD